MVEGGDLPRDVEVVEGLLIGRHRDCQLSVEDDSVSNLHAKIVMSGAQLAMTDLGSHGGTIINGEQVLQEGQTCLLESGLRIRIGRSEFAVIGPNPAALLGDGVPEPFPEDQAAANAEPWGAIKKDSTRLQETVRAVSPFHGQAATPPAQEGGSRPSFEAPTTRRATDSSQADFDRFELRTIVAESEHPLGFEARLKSMNARLVVANEADLRIVPVDQMELTVGRSEGSDLQLLNHGVSMNHARVRFDPASNRFTVEDLGSANGSLIAGSRLRQGVARALTPETHLRFGTVDAVFMLALDSDLHRVSTEYQDGATKLLRSRGKLSAQTIRFARKSGLEQGRSIGETLLLGQFVTAREWCVAVKDARIAANIAALSGSSSKAKTCLTVAVAVVAFVAIALWVRFPGGLASTGIGGPHP